jgi:hypothetical protein
VRGREDPLRLALGRWTAVLNGGNAYDADAMTAALQSSSCGS